MTTVSRKPVPAPLEKRLREHAERASPDAAPEKHSARQSDRRAAPPTSPALPPSPRPRVERVRLTAKERRTPRVLLPDGLPYQPDDSTPRTSRTVQTARTPRLAYTQRAKERDDDELVRSGRCCSRRPAHARESETVVCVQVLPPIEHRRMTAEEAAYDPRLMDPEYDLEAERKRAVDQDRSQALAALQEKWHRKMMKHYRKIFEGIDVNGSGSIEKDDLRAAMNRVGLWPSDR
jgi:hypothetical protein